MRHPLRWILNKLGPGFITGASDDDPSGIASCTQVGAQFGFGHAWTAAYCLPLMIAVQEMVARIGMVAGEGIVSILRKRYSPILVWIFIGLIFCANTINVGSDLGAMADATRLLFPTIPFPALLIGFTVLILALEIFISYKSYANILKWTALSLLAYLLTAILVTRDWSHLAISTFIPQITWSRDYLLGVVALFGTTISPYLFVWQSSEEVEEEVSMGRKHLADRKGATAQELKDMRADVVVGMTFSQFITYCIIVTAASTFFVHGLHDIQSSSQAAQALAPLAGQFAALIFTIGIVGTGLLAVPVLAASAAYALADGLGLASGLSKKYWQAKGFYLTICASTGIGMCMNLLGINPIKALYWTAVFNGLVTPPLLCIILLVANNKKVMGVHTNGWLANIVGWGTVGLTTMLCVVLFLL